MWLLGVVLLGYFWVWILTIRLTMVVTGWVGYGVGYDGWCGVCVECCMWAYCVGLVLMLD